MKHRLINQDFDSSVKQLRRILPKLAFGLLIGTYLISALIMGIFHAQNAPNIGFTIAAYLIPLAIQTGRGTLVFFFQLNPARVQNRFSMGVISATALLGLSLWEGWLVMSPHGLSWKVSVLTLMLIGWVLEIMILRETHFATQLALYQNKEQWQQLKEFYVARYDFQQFMSDLNSGKRPVLELSDSVNINELDASVPNEEEPKEEESLGKLSSPSGNGLMKQQN